ncbi:putative ester cyclase [Palleronia aestuarii]|uniref:Putative ester cyclase n=1 Tax=Palleronia aestuarii TaxID=568105 RepID=A0A2W7N4M0_9RHOB|nr:ester cyclase [Palleronia aestuarii]PZX15021.1 putative ester cyclase [Palleronia aestuarii]
MTPGALRDFYDGYIACLNARDWTALGDFVHEAVRYNEEEVGLAGYRAMLERDVLDIPDLSFRVEWLACEPPLVAARLAFDCTPLGDLFGLPVDGRRVRFHENVFYRIDESRIADVRSIIDRAAVAAQVGALYRVA